MGERKDKPDTMPLEGQTWQRMNAGGEVDNVRVSWVSTNKKIVAVTNLATGEMHEVDPSKFLPEHGWRLYAHGRIS